MVPDHAGFVQVCQTRITPTQGVPRCLRIVAVQYLVDIRNRWQHCKMKRNSTKDMIYMGSLFNFRILLVIKAGTCDKKLWLTFDAAVDVHVIEVGLRLCLQKSQLLVVEGRAEVCYRPHFATKVTQRLHHFLRTVTFNSAIDILYNLFYKDETEGLDNFSTRRMFMSLSQVT